MGKTIRAADLFCGAGGTSSGLKKACDELGYELQLTAINHWDMAIQTHTLNHPGVQHLCESLDNLNPRKVVPEGHLNILVASPECTHHSRARGGRPMSDQSRASAFHILRWAEALRIDNILIENVKEFQDWGPLGVDGKPLKSKKGETFKAFIETLRALNYTVEYRVLRAADYGDPTSRERLFVMARRGNQSIQWPEQTHSATGSNKWHTAREIIDWSIPSKSIFTRKRPLVPNTIKRIEAGLRKYCGKEIEPFLVMLYNTNDARSVDRPLPTVTGGGGHIGLCEPFLVVMKGSSTVKPVDEPVPAVTTHEYVGLCEPFLVEFYGNSKTASVEEPLPTTTTKDRFGVCQPFVLGQQSCASPRSVNSPLPTIATAGAISLVQPELIGSRFDIKFRMLQPHELARAMSFGDDYKFCGTHQEQVKQIGNAVPVMMAKSLCQSLLQAKTAQDILCA